MSLESEFEKIKAANAKAKELLDIYVPADTQEAMKAGLESKALALANGLLLHYSEDQRKIDRVKIVPIKAVFEVLLELEIATKRNIYVNPTYQLWKDFRTIPIVLKFILDEWGLIFKALGEVLKFTGNYFSQMLAHLLNGDFTLPDVDLAKVRVAVVAVWAGIVAGIAWAVSVPAMDGMQRKALFSREQYVNALRKKAFPQRNGSRYTRRKITRTRK